MRPWPGSVGRVPEMAIVALVVWRWPLRLPPSESDPKAAVLCLASLA